MIKEVFFYILFIYLILYILINILKPNLIFDNEKNTLRPFGVGYKHTTIFPLWLVSILLGIFSYFLIIYLNHLKYNNVFIS